MKKIICIGECSLNIVLGHNGQPLGTMPGGRIANAAAFLARDKFNVVMASEASADNVGDIIVDYLSSAGVDTKSVDRFTEGRTALNVFITPEAGSENAVPSLIRYEGYPEEAFDIIWPRIDPGDIVLYGGYYAIDKRMHQRMSKLLEHAAEREAVMIYLPGFLPQQEPRITRVMPQILENLEMAHIVVTRNKDLELIFGVKHPQTCYNDHIDFYCRSLINIDNICDSITYYSGKEMTTAHITAALSNTLLWNAGVVAGTAGYIASQSISPQAFESPDEQLRSEILKAAVACAGQAARELTEQWQKIS